MEKCTSMDYGLTKKVIGLSGYAQTGKDTVAQILVNNYGYKRLAFADAVREGLYKFNPIVDFKMTTRDGYIVDTELVRVADIVNSIGWEKAKQDYKEVRELLQRYGTEAGREIHGSGCWLKIIEDEIAFGEAHKYVLSDIRFPNEYSLVEKYRGTSVRVVRDGIGAVNGHISDSYVPNVDFTIENNGSREELEATIATVLGAIL